MKERILTWTLALLCIARFAWATDYYIHGDVRLYGADPAVIFDGSTASDTDWWFGITADEGGDDNDSLTAGTGTTKGSNTKFTLTKDGALTCASKITGTALDAGDDNITNVGNIALDSISSDAGTSINVDLGSDAGDDFTVDTTKLVVEGDAGNVGIGTANPVVKLVVNGNTSPSASDYMHSDAIQIVGTDNTFAALYIDSFGSIGESGGESYRSVINLRSARGTLASPSGNIADDELGRVSGRSHDGTYFTGSLSSISFMAGETITDENQGSYVIIRTTALGDVGGGSITVPPERVRFQPSGGVSIGDSTFNATDPGDGYLAIENAVGIGTTTPASLLEAEGGLTTTGSVFTLGTKEPTVVANDVLGRINFYAPLEADGSDAILPGASIAAISEDTFSATVNKTSLVFQTGASETATTKMTISSAGDVTISTGNLVVGTSGKGIDFSATSNATGMTSELLDDYEEGTWTPVLSDGTNNATMHANTGGEYTKIGRVVHIYAYVLTTALGSVSGDIRITGLPFAVSSGFKFTGSGAVSYAAGLAITAGHSVVMWSSSADSYLLLRVFDATTGTTKMQHSEWTDDGGIVFHASYISN